ESLVAYTPVAASGWKVAAVIPKSFIQAEINDLRITMLLIGAACLLLSALIAYLISLGVSIPGRMLRAQMKRVNDGDLNLAWADPHKDEMGAISAGFNEMAGTLRTLLARVAASSDYLREQSG
ncbi:methyl-accepting chemotaxis protein, partial [Paenibacillus sepulcri]|nr:methyl-accepting chemotaxis protein [Paenibacillus sepulcri]